MAGNLDSQGYGSAKPCPRFTLLGEAVERPGSDIASGEGGDAPPGLGGPGLGSQSGVNQSVAAGGGNCCFGSAREGVTDRETDADETPDKELAGSIQGNDADLGPNVYAGSLGAVAISSKIVSIGRRFRPVFSGC
ncbi:hypothetical protein [Mesorhizobium sp. WSM3866]|uniref:hypothetical protein n=1 Tax=Mesorhizobium sp. WSM3866 TaxID=422271 RepID=UPI001140F722|nr:hypothetical protein [Mesorhizobium sp. WSM3866]